MGVCQLINGIDGIQPGGQISSGVTVERSSLVVVAGILDAALRSWDVDRFAAKFQIEAATAMLRGYTEDRPRETPLPASALNGCRRLAPWQARRVKEFIDASLDVKIRVRDCAGEVGLSDGYFSIAFRVTFGATVCHYIRCLRVERAKQLMLDSDEPLSQIAVACGFADQAHYSRVFRDVVGISPNRWRRNNLP
jgi:AraC family transcriptional regulator